MARRLQRKERERETKRQEILSAARKVFAAKGFTNATLDEIAAESEFAKGTLYNYFKSKEELFLSIIGSMLDDLTTTTQDAVETGGTSRAILRRVATRIIEYHKTHEDLLMIVALEMNKMRVAKEHRKIRPILGQMHRMVGMLANTLKEDIAGRKIVRENPFQLAQIFVSMIHDWSMRRIFEGGRAQRFDPKREASFIVRLFFDGVSRTGERR